ncbi:putative GTPase-activator protein for Rho-like GTPases [Lyophyllum shimeji]|uniref:GTPase-activator protein for Rho-like GTPases n=1 Tax=Lyophyllum shimeji TaxID=47721 RepID=A0A9P3PI09_LYOSH|nr:putative GTPase-activator protein for Rho-like GTPases [Lyophyllum shimeji]
MDPLPPSRPSTSDASTPPQGPIPLFDAHLRILSDSYLSFFQERKRIEETYVESLLKLHRKIKSFDTYLDDRGELNTTRSAWHEVRDSVEREAQAREAFCATLATDVINPLTTFKETQDRTRKRIKEDLKESGAAYNEYAENMLPKLKSKYNKKFTEVEEQKRAAAAIPPTSPTTPSLGLDQHHHLSNSRSNPSIPSRPTVTSPQPLRALDRRPSGSGPTGRNRSPSSSTAFSDLAHQGKKQLNQLIGFLDKGGAVKETLGGGRENQALRTVRTKREADEADREYRKGVHWLETLRLRRTKILEAGYKSLEMFVEESSTIVKKALERYTDNMTATSTTQTQLSSHARAVVEKISPEKDVAKLKAYIPRSLASAIPEPILYQHGLVGSCSDLIFGFSLVDYATAKGLHDGEVPKIIRICIQEIDRRGLECEGIYRVSGRHAIVQTLQHNIEKDEDSFEFNPQKDDVYAVASLLKLYLRELPEPVFRFPLQERIQHTEDRAEHIANNFMLLRSKIRRLPPVHQATLKALVEHLARVAAFSEKNKMDPKNLAIVFGGVIFGEDEIPKNGDLLSVQSWKDSVMEDLIIHSHILYDEHPNDHSPPLPPTPPGEPVPVYTYGSKTTKVASVPPSTPTASSTNTQASSSPQDFTPRLPLRPTSSIHPSSRANPQTPSRGRPDAPPPPLPLRGANSPNAAESPPPSPSTSSTIYETDEFTSPAQELSIATAATSAGASRPMSPLRPAPAAAEIPHPVAQSHPDPAIPPPV